MLPIVDSTPSELEALHAQLADLQHQLDAGYRNVAQSHSWGFIGVNSRVFDGARITAILVLLNCAALVTGVVLTATGSSLDSLGVALVVGAIFGFGAFGGQFWALATQREVYVYDQITGRIDQLRVLRERYTAREADNGAGIGAERRAGLCQYRVVRAYGLQTMYV
jgi:hypothetical protein